MSRDNKSGSEFSSIAAIASGLGFGAMLSISQALRVGEREILFQVSIWTVVAFLAGFSLTFAYVRYVFGCGKGTPPIIRRGGPVVLVIMAIGAFVYPFRSQSTEKIAVRLAAMGLALCFIAVGMTLVWRIVRAADREEKAQEAGEQSSGASR